MSERGRRWQLIQLKAASIYRMGRESEIAGFCPNVEIPILVVLRPFFISSPPAFGHVPTSPKFSLFPFSSGKKIFCGSMVKRRVSLSLLSCRDLADRSMMMMLAIACLHGLVIAAKGNRRCRFLSFFLFVRSFSSSAGGIGNRSFRP